MKKLYAFKHSTTQHKLKKRKHSLLVLAFFWCFGLGTLCAQTTVTIGDGTSTQYQSPIDRYYNHSASEIIYYGSEIGIDGIITDLSFYKASGSNTVTINEVSIYMKETASTSVSATTSTTGYTLVYNGAFPNDNTGWVGVTLDTPFIYSNTTQNISILVVRPNQGWSSNRPFYAYTTTTENTMSWYHSDPTAWSETSSMTTSTNRPNVQFTITPSTTCVSPTDQPTAFSVSGTTTSGTTGTFTAATSAPDSYLVVRSMAATLAADPTDGTSYYPGDELGGGTVIHTDGTTTFTETSLTPNTTYYYFVYSCNKLCGGGPLYYTASPASASTTTLVDPAVLMGASNITSSTATINWVASEVGGGAASVTYALDVATDSAFSSIVSSFTGLTTTMQDITGLVGGTTYYIRVMVESEGTYATSSFVATDSLTPITVTGFNEDVIANGPGDASASTTNAVDAVDYAFHAVGFNPSGTPYTNGLPANQVLSNSTTPSNLQYFLADYNSNNDLRLGMDGDTGSLTFTTPLPLQEIYLAVTGGSGGAEFTAVVNYNDSSSDTFTGLNAPDWFNNGGYIVNIGARVNLNDNGVGTASGGPRIYQLMITVPTDNQFKLITSIDFTSTTGVFNGNNVLNIFAVGGKIASQCSGAPAGGDASLSETSGSAGSTFTASALNISESAGIAFQWQISADGSTGWTDIPGATTATSTITAPSDVATYYYQLVSTCTASGLSATSTVVSFTTNPCTPSYGNVDNNHLVSAFSITEVGFSDTVTSYTDHDHTGVTIPTLNAGSTYTFEVTATGWMSVGAAANFNGNGVFNDTDEILGLPDYTASDPAIYSFPVTIPATVAPGTYTLRLWAREANAGAGTDPCGSYGWGSWVDYTITVDPPLTTTTIDAFSTLKYYPNPVSNTLNLSCNNAVKTVEITSVTGQKINNLVINNTNAQINTQQLVPGVYFVTVELENAVRKTIRIIKQ